MTQRDDCKLAIAKQLALMEGRIWVRLMPKMQSKYLTIAGNILATVERMMDRHKWSRDV